MGQTHRTGALKALTPAIAGALFLLTAFPASALKTDDNTLVEGAKLCTRYLPRHERQYGIPEHLLAAIASTESGRFHRALGLNLPWPWTINVEGTGYFFDTKEEAIAAVRSFQERGIQSIDVGCMQVNLFHHPNAFATLEQAFDPAYNVAYAAQFLKSNFEEEGSWRKATGDYHSRTPIFGEQYSNLVYGAWSRIINKVADARAGRPILTAAASRGTYATRVHTYHAMHLHDISVARDTTREKGVLVIRPEYGSQPPPMVQASASDDFVEQHFSKSQIAAATAPELSATAPSGSDKSSTGEEVSHGAQIVKIRADGAPAANKGQFEPATHIISGITEAAPAGGASSSGSGALSSGNASNSPFVFNN